MIELTETNSANLQLMCKAIGNGEWAWRDDYKIHIFTKDRTENQRIVNRARVPTSNWIQFWLLFKRMMIQQFRNKVAIYIQIIYHLICMVMFSLMFANTANDGTDVSVHLKFAMPLVVLLSYTWIIIPVLTFPFEIGLLSKEHFNKWYNLIPYYFAWSLSRIPLRITLTLFLTLPIYIISGQPLEIHRFLKFFLVCVLILFNGESFGLAVASFLNITHATIVGTYSIGPLLALAMYGFDFPEQITPWMHFLTNCSFIRCGFVGLLVSMLADNRDKLDCPDVYCHFADPKIILKFIGLDQTSFVFECCLLLAHTIFFRVIAFIGMYTKTKVK